MNIINQPWLPFRFRDGEIKTLPISAISHPDIIDFSLNRICNRVITNDICTRG